MVLGKITKQPVEVIDYDLDYTDFFLAGNDTDTIASHTRTVTRTQVGATTAAASLTTTGVISNPIIRVKVSGGLTGEVYKIEVTMTSTNGRVLQDEIIMTIKEV